MNASDLAKVAEKLPLSESVRKLNLGPEARPSGAATSLDKGEIHTHRTRKCRMNKLELSYYERLKQTFPDDHITPQFRLRVSPWDAPVPVHYTCDFMVSELGPAGHFWKHTVYECKDSRRHFHSDELLRPKCCRQENPWICAVIIAVWDGNAWYEKCIA